MISSTLHPENIHYLDFFRYAFKDFFNMLWTVYSKKFNIILTSGRQLIEELSGGNQQKCIISKWLLSKPKVLILDEPTRGVDVGVKSEMYEIINKLAEDGTAIILISSELPEILSLSHRIIVMREGKITKTLHNQDANQENIMSYAIN